MIDDAELPRHVAVAWGVAAFPQRGPKRELSHEGIVEAAVEIADAEGLAAVTMQRVAASFGFTTMALYRYVASKEELHRLMADAAIDHAALAAIPIDDWRTGLTAWAGVVHERYLDHPWLLELPLARDDLLMPGNVAVADAALRAMRTLALPAEVKLGLLITVSLIVRGFAGIQNEMFVEENRYPPGTKEALSDVVTAGRFPDLAPMMATGAYLGEAVEPEVRDAVVPGESDDMGFGLETYLDGIAVLTQRWGADVPPTPVPSDPEERYQAAERAYQQAVAIRKSAERRVKTLGVQEGKLQRERDAAKEAARAAARSRRYERG